MAKAPAKSAPSDDEMQWKARSALETIRQAEAHKRDPELMKHVKKLHDETAKAIEVVVKPIRKGKK